MKLNYKQIQLLKKVRRNIEQGKDRFICYSIARVSGRTYFELSGDSPNLPHSDARVLVRRIQELLVSKGHRVYTLEHWLESSQGIALYNADYFAKQMRAYRLRWLDQMIKTREL